MSHNRHASQATRNKRSVNNCRKLYYVETAGAVKSITVTECSNSETDATYNKLNVTCDAKNHTESVVIDNCKFATCNISAGLHGTLVYDTYCKGSGGTLAVKNCSVLQTLYCNDSTLRSIAVTGCSALNHVRCDNNKYDSLLPDFIETLYGKGKFCYDQHYRYSFTLGSDEQGRPTYTVSVDDNGRGYRRTDEPYYPVGVGNATVLSTELDRRVLDYHNSGGY